MGAAGNQGHIQQDATYAALLAKQYDLVTPENACKWDAVHPGKDTYDFSKCDVVAQFAKSAGAAFRGHNLCWGQQNPQWLLDGNYTSDQKRAILTNHTQHVASYYGTDALAWDVVNEAVADVPTPSVILKPTVWYPDVPDYIDVAFRSTRRVFGGLLFYNDYNIASSSATARERHPLTGEVLSMGSEAKSNAVYAMVKGMVERGIPIDGVGFQVHVAHTYAQFDGVAANMERLARLGLQIHLTELDVTCEATHCTLEEQASVYRSMLRVCLREPACTSFETWGFTDLYTWKGSDARPLPFDATYAPKPAFHALVNELMDNSTSVWHPHRVRDDAR